MIKQTGIVMSVSAIILLVIFIITSQGEQTALAASKTTDICTKDQELEYRLNALEPDKPITFFKSPEQNETESNYPSNTYSITQVIDFGSKISFYTIKNDPNYVRPVYNEHWHSTNYGGRWSYVPSRIYYALHRIFPTYGIGLSGEMNFKENVGIDFPISVNRRDLDLYLVVFQTNVKAVYTKGNQIVVVGTPNRNGVQVIDIKTKDIHPSDFNKFLLIQLAIETYELDYALIEYEPPNFWAGREYINKNKKWFEKTYFK